MSAENDILWYSRAVETLKNEPVEGPDGATYHVKNGVIHYGYDVIGTTGFSLSQHCWNIFH